MRVLNPLASALWLLLDESAHDAGSLLRAWQGLASTSHPGIKDDIAATLEEWFALGWLDKAGQAFRITRHFGAEIDTLRGRGMRLPADTTLPSFSEVGVLHLKLSSRHFRLRLGSTGRQGLLHTSSRLRAVLSALAVEESGEDAVELTWVQDGEIFWLASPEAVLRTIDESLALSSVVTALFQYSYSAVGLFATLHAAAVSMAGGSLVLSGVSGAGKSTLSAYLAAQGWGYLGDDVIALGRPITSGPFEIYPFPTAIGLKPKSWPVLRRYYPEIDSLPVVPYADRQARYLPLPRKNLEVGASRLIRAVVLPRYREGVSIEIESVSSVEALCDLIQAGVTTGESLHPSRVDVLLDMLETVPAYRMSYSDLNDAQQVLEELCTCS